MSRSRKRSEYKDLVVVPGPNGHAEPFVAPGTDGTFFGSNLRWPVERARRTFVVRVVEPSKYSPSEHDQLFSGVITQLLNPEPTPIDSYSDQITPPIDRSFDLVTFPEAFASPESLLPVLETIGTIGAIGCIHVGLRPSENPAQHLFSKAELVALDDRLAKLPKTVSSDFEGFRHWLARQPATNRRFNVGCIFMVDANEALRICLHPKLVRSKFEATLLPESHLEEADLLTLITLVPANKRHLSVTLQPLICSDAIDLPTDRQIASPMQAITQHAACFGDFPPDHVDVVSVVACTPQQENKTQEGSPFRTWHEKFQNTFTGAAQGPNYSRHHFSTIVLANFHTMADSSPGGLSGIFMPVPPRKQELPRGVAISCFGQAKGRRLRNNWSTPDDGALTAWDNVGFVAGLDPFASPTGATVKILSFTVLRLPRDNSRWDQPESIAQVQIQVANRTQAGTLKFANIGEQDAK